MPLPAYSPPPRAYHSAEQTELHRILGSYLFAQIDVFCPGRNRYGRLVGLPAVSPGERPVADVVLFQTADERKQSVLFDLSEPICNLLPVLRPFEQLCTPLEDGTVPAVEVARIALSLSADSGPFTPHQGYYFQLGKREFKSDNVRIEYDWEGSLIKIVINKTWQVFVGTNGDQAMSQPDDYVGVIEYLRRNHFAVGLTEKQYHRMPAPALATA